MKFLNTADMLKANQHVLMPLQNNGITAVIAGGFLRDCYLDKPWKDIDLIVHYDQAHKAKKILFDTYQPYIPDIVSDGDPRYVHFCLHEQGEAELVGEWNPTVNLIVWKSSADMPTVEDAARRINFGLCQIAWDGKQVFATNAFVQDVKRQSFTLTRTDMGLEGSMSHWIRLQQKYPDWPMYLGVQEDLLGV